MTRVLRNLFTHLLELAGYGDDPNGTRLPRGGARADEYYAILQALRYIGNRKVDEYGDSRLAEVDSVDYDTKMLYSDLYRKHIRINQLMNSIKEEIWHEYREPSVDKLMETFADLAVYSVRGIQILRILQEKGKL